MRQEQLPPGSEAALTQLTAWFSERFANLDALAREFLAVLNLNTVGTLDIGQTERRRLRNIAVKYLAENTPVDGCGISFSRAAMSSELGHLEWWVREDEHRFARYSFGLVPGGDRYYDYEHHEWFIRAFHEGKATLAGPYYDYLGVEMYVITLTVPLEIAGVRVGAVGNDIRISDVEADLLPILLSIPNEAVLLGPHRNVLVSNSSRFMPGDFVGEDPQGFSRVHFAPAAAGVTLLLAADSHYHPATASPEW